MRPRFKQALLSVGLLLMTALALGADIFETVAGRDYQLPSDPGAEIIRFDSLGGMLPRQGEQPLLSIKADGSLIIAGAWTGAESRRMRLGSSDLQALLSFIIAEKQFLKIEPADIKQQMTDSQRQEGRLFAIADAATTLIAVELPAYRHRVEFYAVDWAARQFPEIASLQNLRAVQNRLKALMDAAQNHTP